MGANRIRTHDLKTWHAPFASLWSGAKKHEVRRNDRGYMAGDVLYLREYDPGNGVHIHHTGRAVCALVTYVSEGGTWGLPADLCVMSIEQVDTTVHYTIGCFDVAASKATQ